jgi:hypothetical protein
MSLFSHSKLSHTNFIQCVQCFPTSESNAQNVLRTCRTCEVFNILTNVSHNSNAINLTQCLNILSEIHEKYYRKVIKPFPVDLHVPHKNLFRDIMTSSVDTFTPKSWTPTAQYMSNVQTMPWIPHIVTLKIPALSL